MIAKSYAAYDTTSPLRPWSLERRDVGPHDVRLDILYCGICHSDIHTVRGDWGPQHYPLVPGHEIVGRVAEVGSAVTGYRVGDLAGIGCMVDSCRHCGSCREGYENSCEHEPIWTYGSTGRDGLVTQGGYSSTIVCDEAYVLRVSERLPLAGVAPLLCAGITTYSPLRRWGVGPGHRVAVLGLGGLGHMGVKFARAFGAEVTVLSTSASKESSARELGAHHFVNTRDEAQMAGLQGKFDLILDTVSAPHDYDSSLRMLRRGGALVCVGLPTEPAAVSVFSLVSGNKILTGSGIGGIAETQEMLDYCAEHGIVSDVEVISADRINEAYERVLASDVKYRFVIDMGTP